MTKQRFTPLEETPWSYDFHGTYDPENRSWFVQMTYYENDDAVYTCSLSRQSLVVAIRELEKFSYQVLLDKQEDKLLLPHMGDYEVSYFPKSKST